MKQGTANLAEDYCFIHKALRPVGTARRQIAAVPPSNSRPEPSTTITNTSTALLVDASYRFISVMSAPIAKPVMTGYMVNRR